MERVTVLQCLEVASPWLSSSETSAGTAGVPGPELLPSKRSSSSALPVLWEEAPPMLSDTATVVRSCGLPVSTAPTEPLLCKFADGGQKKRQNPNKYIPNGRPWHREGEVRLVSPFLELQCGCALVNT